ncbi:MAG: hypothetical protein U9R79_17545 [Armatimonadota bacterium]|nr:hypothetical protein [Armatimonadota bacterium]
MAEERGGAWGGITRAWHRSCALRGAVYLLLAVIILGGVPWAYAYWRTERELAAELERIEQSGDPMTLAEMAPQPVPDDQNAAVLYQQVFRVDLRPDAEDRESVLAATGWSELVEVDYLTGAVSDDMVRPALEDPTVARALETLRRASQRPHCVFEIDWTRGSQIVFPHYMHEATRWLAARARLCTHDGEIDEALGWYRVILRMSEHAAAEPLLSSALFACSSQTIALGHARETLARGTPSPAAARSMIEYLRTVNRQRSFLHAMLGERAQAIDLIRETRQHPETVREILGSNSSGIQNVVLWLYMSRLGRPLLNAYAVAYLRELSREIEAVRTVADRRVLYRGVHPPEEELTPLSLVFIGATSRAAKISDAAAAELDLFEVVLALKIHRQQHGEYPVDLSQLQTAVDYDLPPDVFTGKPLHYRRHGDGFVVWSVGKDLDDDGGHGPREPGYDWDDCDVVWRCER